MKRGEKFNSKKVVFSDVNVGCCIPCRDYLGWLSKWFYLLFLPAAKTKERKNRYTLKPQKPLEVFGDAKTHFALTSIQLFNECFQYLTTVLPSTECLVSCRGDALNGLFCGFFQRGRGGARNRVKWWVELKQDLFSGMRVGGRFVRARVCVWVWENDIAIPVNINSEYMKCFNFKQ